MPHLNNKKTYVKNSSILINRLGSSGCRIIFNSGKIVVSLGTKELESDEPKIEKLIA